jgi:predicted nuclease with TOPRIM domain
MDRKEEMRALLAKLQADKAALVARAAPHRSAYDLLRQQINALEAKAKREAEKFHAIERPAMSELDEQISGLARALGGRRMSEAAGE